jgi:Beta protein
MESTFYLPLLKSKDGEFKALAKLNLKLKSKIIPLFDVTRMAFDHESNDKPKTVEDHLQKFCKKVVKCWNGYPMFLDTTLVNADRAAGMPSVEFIYSELAKKDIYPMPVVHTSSSADYIESIQGILLLYNVNEIAIRVTIDDITSLEFEDNINRILDILDLPCGKCHLIFDLKAADFSQMDDFADGILDALSEFPHFGEWQSFTLAGGAFPAMSKIKSETEELVPRNDWIFYNTIVKKLKKTRINRIINFGDYSIVPAGDFEFDPKIMSISANIRYTHNEAWYVVKGKALKKSSDWQQYYDQAAKIAKSKYYLGESFSEGDLHIRKCANRLTKTGNANVWIQMGTNHHFTKVLTDLFAKSA